MSRQIPIPGYRIDPKTGKPVRVPKDASQKQKWKGSQKVRVKRKGAYV